MIKDAPWSPRNVDARKALEDGDLEPLLNLLRSGEAIHSSILHRLADMLDPNIETELSFEKNRKSAHQRKPIQSQSAAW